MNSVLTLVSEKLSAIFKEEGKSIGNFAVVILTTTVNQVLKKSFFKCPNKIHKKYGLCFMIVPALILTLLTLLISFSANQHLAGICKRNEDGTEKSLRGKRSRKWIFVLRQMGFSLVQSLLAFACWVVLTLLTSDAISCIKVGPMPKNAAGNKTIIENYQIKKERYDSLSQIWGLALLVTCLAVALVFYCLKKCRYMDPKQKLLASMRRYDELEALAANKAFEAHMTEVAKQTGTKLVHNKFAIETCSLGCGQSDEESTSTTTTTTTTTTTSSTLTGDHIAEVRSFLAMKYPRLENKDNTDIPYRVENFEDLTIERQNGEMTTLLPAKKTCR